MRGGWRRAAFARVALLSMWALASGCIDFGFAQEECVRIGRCEGAVTADGGDAGEPTDGGGLDDGGSDGGTDGGDADAGPDTSCDQGFRVVGEVCSPAGWCWENPWPTGANLNAVDGVGDTAFIAGGAGTLLRNGGCLIEQLQLDTTQDLVSVAAVSEDEVWVTGPGGTVIRWADGPTAFSYPAGLWVSSVTRFLGGVAAATQVPGGDVRSYPGTNVQGDLVNGNLGFGVRRLLTDPGSGFWALATDGGVFRAFGANDAFVTITHGASGELRDLAVSPAGNAYVAGNAGELWRSEGSTPFQRFAPQEVFDAGSTSGVTIDLLAVTAPSDDTLYVSGTRGRLFQFHDGGWTPIARMGAPDIVFEGHEMRDIWASSSGFVVAVGTRGALVNNANGWNDVHWSERGTRLRNLYDIDGVEGEVWAVGEANTTLCRRNGEPWKQCEMPSGHNRDYAALEVLSAGHVVAAGDSVISELQQGAWNSGSFIQLDGGLAPTDISGTWFLRSMVRDANGIVWAAGDYGKRGLLVWRALNGNWFEAASFPAALHDVAVAPDGNVWVAGNEGVLMELTPDGGALASHHDGGEDFYAVHVTSSGTVFAGGLNYARRFNATNPSMNASATLPNQQVNDFIETASGVRMLGSAGTVWNFTGQSPFVEEQPVDAHLFDGYVAPDGTVFICGDRGTVIRQDPQ